MNAKCDLCDKRPGNRTVIVSGIETWVCDECSCDHKWKWVKDWYGDPNVINGTQNISGWVCTECGSTECENDPPQEGDDYDEDLRWPKKGEI